jgi:D-inositol-3-phosphate glycosyltransferase
MAAEYPAHSCRKPLRASFRPECESVNPDCEQSNARRFAYEPPRLSDDVADGVKNEPVNIAMISAQASPLGTAGSDEQSAHVAELSAALARRGHRVTVYTRRDNAHLPECAETPQGYNVVHVPAGPPQRLVGDELLPALSPFAQYLAAHWADGAPDVTHAHSWTSGIVAELAARPLGLPTVLTFHGLGTDELRRRLESKLAKAATQVSASCTAEAFELIRMGRPRSGTAIIPSGVDLSRFTPNGSQAPRSDAPRVVGVGKLVSGNGFDALIRGLPGIPDTEFVIVGETDVGESRAEASRLRGLATRLGVADRLRLHGAVAPEDMPAMLRSADIVACTGTDESSGVVALKAMACGVPVVASAAGALVDIVVDDVTGRLVEHRDPRQLAAAVNALLRDSFLRRSLGGAGRDRALARYGWDRIAGDTVRLYQASLSVGSKPKATAG